MADRDDDAANITHPAPGGVGLLIIDMINSMAFEGAKTIRANADASADVILKLRQEADRLKTPVIYVNDNYGQWHSDKSKLVAAPGLRHGLAQCQELQSTIFDLLLQGIDAGIAGYCVFRRLAVAPSNGLDSAGKLCLG